jgi:hypothetical protein
LFISADNGENWQEYSGINDMMTTSQYYTVKDSLVGTYRDVLFTLKWNGLNYYMRFLKNDALAGTRINGVEVLRDSVYAATTSGLFVKPVAAFFDGR